MKKWRNTVKIFDKIRNIAEQMDMLEKESLRYKILQTKVKILGYFILLYNNKLPIKKGSGISA